MEKFLKDQIKSGMRRTLLTIGTIIVGTIALITLILILSESANQEIGQIMLIVMSAIIGTLVLSAFVYLVTHKKWISLGIISWLTPLFFVFPFYMMTWGESSTSETIRKIYFWYNNLGYLDYGIIMVILNALLFKKLTKRLLETGQENIAYELMGIDKKKLESDIEEDISKQPDIHNKN